MSDVQPGAEDKRAHRIALNFEDGATRFIDCNDGESVLDAAFRQGVNLPMDCSDGVCGTCKCRCDLGDYDLGDDYLDDPLTADEAADRQVLTCQMTVSSDCIIAVSASSSACKVKPREHRCKVMCIERVSNSTIILTLRPDDPATLDFLAGQYVHVIVPGTGEHRSYSFSSSPGAAQASFLIRTVPGGLMSEWLANHATLGTRLTLVGPHGSFFLRPVERPTIMLAGGTGLAPILSMLESLADLGTVQPIHLIYGVARDVDMVGIDRIRVLATRIPTINWIVCVADPETSQLLRGYVTDHLTSEHLNAGNCDVYACGPPPMVDAVQNLFSSQGIRPEHFYYEKFAPAMTAFRARSSPAGRDNSAGSGHNRPHVPTLTDDRFREAPSGL